MRTHALVALVTVALAFGPTLPWALAQAPAQPAAPSPPAASPPGQAAAAPEQAGDEKKLPPEQLEALVAPIALYPDPLLSQALMASTYPLEIIQAQQWLAKNASLKGDALEAEVKKQAWEPAVQATVLVPDLLKRLAEDITWTTNLGNAFLAQQQDMLDAVQRLRVKAKDSGKLESNDKMKVETKVVEQKTVVVIEQPNPQVVYVPAYNPTVVWGPPPYPYPPVYYPPPPPPGAMLFTFTMGVAMGAAMHGGPCCSCGWGHSNTVVINNNNTFVNNRNVQNNVRPGGANSSWQHNPQHRGGAPYGDRATAAKYGGGGQRGGSPGASTMDRGGAGGYGGNRGGAGPSTMDRGGAGGYGGNRGGAGPSTMDRGGAGGYGGGGGHGGGYGGGGSQVGNRSVSPSSGGSAFGGAGGGGNRATASSSRGASSMGGGRGGGGGGGRRR